MDLQHVIFRSPLPVNLEFVEEEKPKDYYLYPGTARLGEKIKVWKVQTKSFPEVDPGLVSSRERFLNTPDAEIISGGINGKGPQSVAIARHGNYFLWGFYAQPKHMTESAQRAFINSVCYIAKFDGQRAGPVQATYGGRDAFLANVYWLRSVSDEYLDLMVKDFKEQIEEYPSAEMLEQVGDDPKAYFRSMFGKFAEQRRNEIPGDVRQQCQDDTERLIAYYDQNIEYLTKDEAGGYRVDPDVKKLKISNRSMELLEKCIELLDQDGQAETAMGMLDRYTRQSFDDAEGWRNWWQKSRERIRYDSTAEIFVTSP